MLSVLKGKKIKVGIALCTGMTMGLHTVYYDGVLEDFDNDFIMFSNGTMIAIKYIQTIEVIN